jgi:hypothetical protein
MAMAQPLLTDEWTDEQIGHDLWLTRCGHGAGFWDRNLPNGDKLTEICELIRFHGEVYAENGVAYIHESEFPLDLVFEQYERLPQNVQDILSECEDFENTYEACGELQEKLEAVGYTISYDLSAEPYHLKYKG